MKKLLFFVTVLVGFTMNTALAAHWVPLIGGSERVSSVAFDADSVKRTQDNLYFWEKVESSSGEYQLRVARIGLKDFDFADAEIAQKRFGQKMVYMHPQEWEEHGSSVHPLRLAWMDKVLKQADGADIIPAEVKVENVKVPENLQ